MAGGMNLATRYAKQVDERFHRESQAMMGLNSDYSFTGAETVKVYHLPVVAMSDYRRTGANRYGDPNDLARNVQTMTVKKDRAFTFIIDRGDKIQSQMVSDAGKALSRQLREVCVPEFDTYCFKTLAEAATQRGAISTTPATKENAYSLFLDGMEYLGNRNVPDKGRVCFCTYKFANLLKQDSAFMKYGDATQQMLVKGVIGEVDGCRIVKVPASRLPAGAAFLLTHPVAAAGPKQLEDYKIHDNPPGISGWLVEGRMIYDCFVLEAKADAIYYHGSQAVLKELLVQAVPTGSDEVAILLTAEREGSTRHYVTAATAGDLVAVTFGQAITPSQWTALPDEGVTFTPTKGHKFLRVVEVDDANLPLAVGNTVLHLE